MFIPSSDDQPNPSLFSFCHLYIGVQSNKHRSISVFVFVNFFLKCFCYLSSIFFFLFVLFCLFLFQLVSIHFVYPKNQHHQTSYLWTYYPNSEDMWQPFSVSFVRYLVHPLCCQKAVDYYCCCVLIMIVVIIILSLSLMYSPLIQSLILYCVSFQ